MSSPLGRCRALAELIGSAFHLQPAYDRRLQEMDFGAWEGRDWNDIPRTELDAWAADFLHARPHGGASNGSKQSKIAERVPDGTQQVGQEHSKPHGRTARCPLHSWQVTAWGETLLCSSKCPRIDHVYPAPTKTIHIPRCH